tara:strand:- start:1134 stop:1709 length:576 start_codon:yes stop_codon:yes gene_type:complete
MASWEAIKTQYVESTGISDVTFSSIPQTYQHLKLTMSARTVKATSNWYESINVEIAGSSAFAAGGYNMTQMYANGGSSGAASTSVNIAAPWSAFATSLANPRGSAYALSELLFPDYTNSNVFHGYLSFHNNSVSDSTGAGTTYTTLVSTNLNSNGATAAQKFAIEKIKLDPYGSNNYQLGSMFTLYGLKSS